MPDIIIELAVLFLLILVNGLFAMSEIAVVSARRVRLQRMAEAGDKGAEIALQLARAPNRLLSTVQAGITLVGILAGAFGGATLARELAPLLRDIPVIGDYATAVSLFLVVGAITYLSVVIGELVPKRIALNNAERIAALVARPMQFLATLAAPLVRLLGLSTEAVLRILGVPASPRDEISEEEIRILVEQGAQQGIIEEAERDMVESVFRLNDRPLEAMMTPRTEIVWLDINDSEQTNGQIVRNSHHARFPVCDGDLDNVVGIAHAADLLANYVSSQALELTSLREPLFLPETMPALHALESFKASGSAMALLVDEYGGTEGLVTLVDILEAIVGDIPTPAELAEPPITQREDGSWLVDGLLTLDEFREKFDVYTFPDEGRYQTIGGFLIFMLGELPRAGDFLEWEEMRFEIMDMDGRRVDKILMERGGSG